MMRVFSSTTLLLLCVLLGYYCHGWSTQPMSQQKKCITSRRNWLLIHTPITTVVSVAYLSFLQQQPAQAISTADDPSNNNNKVVLEKLQLGHARVRYLLDHWDEVTQVCGTTVLSDMERKQIVRTEGGATCSKTPLRVQDFMGYKSTQDPLYRADQRMIQASRWVDPDSMSDYLDVVEQYREKADQTALLAYTSSWGEANPNGGKEVIEEYLEQTRTQVIESERLLKQVLDYLHLEPLPPLQGKL